MDRNKLTEIVIGCAIKVHKELGPGLLESVYEECLAYELSKTSIPFVRQKSFPVKYENVSIESGYRVDLLINDELIVEIKAVEQLLPIHQSQILTYMKLLKLNIGLLINFNVTLLKNGLKRFVF